MVATAEGIADLLQGVAGELAAKIHGNLAGERDGVGPAFALHVRVADLKMVGDALLDALDVEPVLRLFHEHVLQQVLGDGEVEGFAREGGVAGDLDERTFEPADVFDDVLRHELKNVCGNFHLQVGGLGAQNGDTGFQVGRLDVGGETPLETGNEAGFEGGDFRDRTVAGDDDLLAGLEEVVEGVEKFFLDALFAGEELDVVDQKDVDAAVTLAEFRERVLLDGMDKFIGEFFRGEIGDAGFGIALEDAVSDGVHQVGLAETGGTVDEKGIVGLRRGLGDREGGGMGELVVRPDHEVLERIAWVE